MSLCLSRRETTRPKLDKTMVKLQDNTTKQLTKNGNYPHANHTEEPFIPVGKFFFHFMLGSSSWTPSVTKFKAWFTVLNPLENKVVLIKRSMEFFFIFTENVILFYCYYYFVLYIQNILPPPEFIIVVDCVVIRATFVLGGPLYKLLFLNVKTPGS